MITTRTVSTVVPTPRSAVWAWISDPRKVPPGHVVEQVEERSGWFRRTVRTWILGITVRITVETTEYNPPAKITVVTRDVTSKIPQWLLVSGMRDTWLLAEAGDGATRIERTVQLRHRLPGTMLVRDQLRRQLRQVGKAIAG